MTRYLISHGVGMAASLHCPGMYCGRVRFADSGNFSDCGACPRGFRVEASVCEECVSSPEVYDWLYLGFMVLVSVYAQGWIIDRAPRVIKYRALVLQVCCLLENLLAAVLSLLSVPPTGSLLLTTCPVKRLSDWYTLLHNPSPYYKQTLHCSQEAVYPFYSIVFVFLGYSLVLLVLIRGFLLPRMFSSFSIEAIRKTIYLTLYAIPIIAVGHAIFAGLFYYTFSYLVILLSVFSVACHMAARPNQTARKLISDSLELRNLVIIVSHWLIHGFGLIASLINDYGLDSFYSLLLIPLPTAFYVYTARYTDPELNYRYL
ncbi:JNK1/MAPK8-associated membrane protein [Galendromus occidentalis]|uniref:JNK1/MAPK8-associated membrane protein n=1 Tax=Galendromus occidentalis TaxID=34638 RepID=A0AAJ6VVZ1_9ACAR|nr:JNK1/MAPK8-associated membrane protein [Galendromus occidentalis]